MSSVPLVNLPKLNFNLFVFITALIALGFGEAYHLCLLKWFGALASATSLLSLIFCIWAYTRYYCKDTKNINKNKGKPS